MLILYVLTVLSFVALVWAAVAITRHIRRSSSTSSEPFHPTTFSKDPGRSDPEFRRSDTSPSRSGSPAPVKHL